MKEAELFDGTVLEFPDTTSDDVVQRVAKQQTLSRRGATPGSPSPAPNASAAPSAPLVQEDARDPRGVPGGTPAPAAPVDTIGDKAMRTSAGVLGAPVDLVNTIMGKVGLPSSEAPMFGSGQIEGMMKSASGARESRDISATAPGVSQEGGAPLSQRVYSSFLNTPKARETYLSESYGREGEGWYKLADQFGNPTDRYVTRGADGAEKLFNPPGIDMGDVAGMAGGVPDLIGAIMGGAASVPAYVGGPLVGIPASAALSSAGAQLVGEPVGRLFPENREAEPSIASDVLPRAGGEAMRDAIISVAVGGAGKVASSAVNKASAPFAASASDPLATEYRAAADRLKQKGYDIKPMPSEGGAGGFVPRVEGFLEKLPGSSEKMRQYRQSGDDAVARYQGDLAGGANPNEIGRDVVSELGTQRKNLIIDREEALQRADEGIAANEQSLTARQGPAMSAEAAGQQTRGGLERARGEFRGEAKRLYDIARAAPGGRDAIVDMTPVRAQVKRIRAALPPGASRSENRATGLLDEHGTPMTRQVEVGGGPSSEFTPQGLSRMLGGVDDIAQSMTLDQARQMRTLVGDAIDDKNIMPGVPERYLVELRQSLSGAIDGSVDNVADPTLKNALSAANRHYAENVDRFSRKGVAEVYRGPTSPGYVEDNGLVARLFSGRGKPGVVRETRDLMGADSPEWAATRRSAVEQILDAGRDQTRQGRRLVNVDGLVAKLNGLDNETVQELFGVSDAQQLRNLASDISNRSKYLDADAMSQNGSPNILLQLQAAAKADDQIARDYRVGVIAPFLRGENGLAAKMRPEELVPWLYRRAAPYEAKAVMSKLPEPMRKEVERGAIADIIEGAISKGNGDIGSVRRLVSGEANPADSQSIAAILGAGKDSVGREQAERINALVSPENRQALRDLALITAKRQERDATTSAIGGLAAGAAITGILSRPATAMQAAVISRGLAQLVTSPAFRKWVTNTKQAHVGPLGEAQAIALTPATVHTITGALGENNDVQTALDWLNEGLSQVDEAGKRVVRPPKGTNSWEQYFGGDEMMDAITRRRR
ncbi:MAG: hypothetical protein E5Y65_08735 [Mesorhizobium sp.]|uniref:hypothetical protein n=4 Tax=Mesorhizobium sp. TaxID=1871066 RepID=UPI00121ADFE0|nr:hypothetical protein [Mesorhizobium sp.]TIL91711.1 MAG: hypothetical protein E5Y65_08735 [Mesorhizobium sp.]